MKYLSILSTAFALCFAVGATVHNLLYFVPHDSIARTIRFIPNPGSDKMDDVKAPAGEKLLLEVPNKWSGMFRTFVENPTREGVIGEVTFQGWLGLTWYDVSAIDHHYDSTGIHRIYPANRPNDPRSGCMKMPCDGVYLNPDDKQTKSTEGTDLVVEMGVPPSEKELAAKRFMA